VNLPAWLKPALTPFAAPGLLRKILRLDANTYLSTEISDGKRTLVIIRGKITSEKA
jgi:hypothetical protein